MGWPALLVLVRHAESEGNVRTTEERTLFEVSTHEYPLTERGREQAAVTGDYLMREFGEFDVNYVSYYHRSIETMKILYPEARVFQDPRLAEAQRGIWHVMTEEQIREKYPEELKRREREGWYHFRPWGGESWPDVELRIHSFLGTLARDCTGKTVCMVVHGNWLVLFQRLIHHFSIEEAVAKYQAHPFGNAGVTVYQSAPRKYQRLKLVSENIVPWQGQL